MTTLPAALVNQGFVFKHNPLPVAPVTYLELIACVKEIRRVVGTGDCLCEGREHLQCAIRKVLDDNKACHDLGL